MTIALEDLALSANLKPRNTLQKVGLVGCGSVGQGITRLISQYGIEVHFVDIDENRVKTIFEKLDVQLEEVISKWGLTSSEKKAILSRITGSADYKDLHDCDIIIETIHSKRQGTSLELRKEVFRRVEEVVGKDTVITSNTSTLMISELATVLKYPERAVGLHFLMPATDVKIVEVVKGVTTSDEAYEMVLKFARMIGKKVVTVTESPGNISTRLIITLINEACEVLMEGVASAHCIDETMRSGYGLQFGPFELADMIGLDKLLKWMDNLYHEYGEQKFKASPILKRLVRANFFGKESGRGFYKYVNGRIVDQNVSCTELTM